MGADVEALLDGAQVAAEGCRPDDPGAHNSGLWLGAALGELARNGRDKLTFIVDDEEISSVGLWLEQLVAESTGKHGRGILPVADEPRRRAGGLRRRPRLRPPQGRRARSSTRRSAASRTPATRC